jgi:alkylation response protein AidB-like acyl-CoA dehydrogenase
MSPHAVKPTPPSTDPAKYNLHHEKFSNSAIPLDLAGWVERAAQVASILAEDVVVRDKVQKTPAAEVSLLKSSGLLKVLGPVKYGGGGQTWDVGYKVIREVAKGDG